MLTIEQETYIIPRKEVKNIQEFLSDIHVELGGYAKQFTSSECFLTKNSEDVKVKLISFDKDYLIQDILSEIANAGYVLPEAQDALWFASTYPEVQQKYPIAFLHKPWIRPETGGENVLILRNYNGAKFLHMHLYDSRWYSHLRFVVIEK